MAKKPQKRVALLKPIKAWAGIADGKIHKWGPTNGDYYEIYPRRSLAKLHYDEVVRVQITPLSK